MTDDYGTPIIECVICGIEYELGTDHKCHPDAVQAFDDNIKRQEAQMDQVDEPEYEERLDDGFVMLDGEVWPVEEL